MRGKTERAGGEKCTYLPNNKIVHPITTRPKRNTIRTITQWPNLRDNNPGTRPPTVAEMNYKQPNHDNGAPACRLVRFPLVTVLGDDDGDDYVARCHADCADGEYGFAANLVDVEHRGDRREKHYYADDACGEERHGSGGEAKGGEYCGGVVEDCIYSGPLLKKPGIR